MTWREQYRRALAATEPLDVPLFSRRQAAVMVPVVEMDGEPSLLLTRRSSALAAHPGEISFPGGGVEPGDASSYETALREAAEEIGLDASSALPLGRLDDTVTITGFRVRPHAVFLPGEPDLKVQHGEVQTVFTAPLSFFRQRAHAGYRLYGYEERVQQRLLLYNYRGNVIWGATARIIDNLVQATTGSTGAASDQLGLTRRRIVRSLLGAGTVILTTHVNPDPDGLGCQVALEELLGSLGKKVIIANHHPVPSRCAFLQPRSIMRCGEEITADLAEGADLMLVVDTADSRRVGSAKRLLEPMGPRVAVLDHHLAGDLDGELSFRAAEFCSTAEIVFGLLSRVGFPFTPRAVDALYAGLAFDTGSFRYIGRRSEPLILAAQLLDMGADGPAIQERLFYDVPRGQVQALTMALNRITLELEDRWAWVTLDAAELESAGLAREDTGEIAPFLLSMEGVRVATFVRVTASGEVRVSMRSRRGYPIGQICMALGGGGHANAGGATVRDSLEQVMARLREEVRAVLDTGEQETGDQKREK